MEQVTNIYILCRIAWMKGYKAFGMAGGLFSFSELVGWIQGTAAAIGAVAGAFVALLALEKAWYERKKRRKDES